MLFSNAYYDPTLCMSNNHIHDIIKVQCLLPVYRSISVLPLVVASFKEGERFLRVFHLSSILNHDIVKHFPCLNYKLLTVWFNLLNLGFV